MDLIESLRRVPLFRRLSVENLRQLANIAEEHQVAPGFRLTRQGDVGTTLFLIGRGEAIIYHIDEFGVQRPVGSLAAGEYFGITSLFVDEARDASITALSEMLVWSIARADFQSLLSQNPSLTRQLLIPRAILERLRAPRYTWLEPREAVIYHTRRHWIVLVQRLGITTVAALLLLGLIGVLWILGIPLAQLWVFIPPAILLYIPILAWHWVDWRNDYFVITSLRVAHHERVMFIYEALHEVPLYRVQNVNLERESLGWWLDYGDLTIETAATVGTVHFSTVPHPTRMQEAILSRLAAARATRYAVQREHIHGELTRRLSLEKAEPLPDISSEEATLRDDVAAIEAPMVRPGLLTRAVRWLGALQVFPRTRIEKPDTIIWRRHYLFLFRGIAPAALLIALTATASLLGFLGLPPVLYETIPYLPYVSLAGLLFSMAWLWYESTDWANDQYVITKERIIDIKRRPFPPKEQRREARLDMIQNVSLEINSVLGYLFNFGDVLVQTAGPGTFTFSGAANPREVQREIFRRMEAFREQQAERDRGTREREIIEWLAVYDELKQPKLVNPIPTAETPEAPPAKPLTPPKERKRRRTI